MFSEKKIRKTETFSSKKRFSYIFTKVNEQRETELWKEMIVKSRRNKKSEENENKTKKFVV